VNLEKVERLETISINHTFLNRMIVLYIVMSVYEDTSQAISCHP